LEEVRRLNADLQQGPGACATHYFCNVEEAMAHAFWRVMRRDVNAASETDNSFVPCGVVDRPFGRVPRVLSVVVLNEGADFDLEPTKRMPLSDPMADYSQLEIGGSVISVGS
jgi:hypothetical protein